MNDSILQAAADHRRAHRTPVLQNAFVRPLGQIAPAMPVVIHDLSRTGVGFSCALNLPAGSRFTLWFDSPTTPPVECRVVHNYALAAGWWAIGAEFVPHPAPLPEPSDPIDRTTLPGVRGRPYSAELCE